MRARVSGLLVGLSLTAVMFGCGAGASPRESALWREYRASSQRHPQADAVALFAGDEHLEREALVSAVLARNPSVNAAREALRAALAEIPQMTALDDPMVGYELAPLSIVGDAPYGQVVSVKQKLPFPGKRRRPARAPSCRSSRFASDHSAKPRVRASVARAPSSRSRSATTTPTSS